MYLVRVHLYKDSNNNNNNRHSNRQEEHGCNNYSNNINNSSCSYRLRVQPKVHVEHFSLRPLLLLRMKPHRQLHTRELYPAYLDKHPLHHPHLSSAYTSKVTKHLHLCLNRVIAHRLHNQPPLKCQPPLKWRNWDVLHVRASVQYRYRWTDRSPVYNLLLPIKNQQLETLERVRKFLLILAGKHVSR